MANNTPQNETRTSIDEVNDTLTDLGEKVQQNSKAILYGCIAAAVVVIGILVYIYAVRQPGIKAADEALGQADIELLMGNDSIALDKYRAVAQKHGYQGGNLAALNAAILLYKDGKWDEALKYLQDYSATDAIIGAGAKSLEGDCYVNLKQYDKALGCFRKAAKISDNNPAYTPVFMLKEATVLRAMGNYADEAKIYKQLKERYPAYAAQMGIDAEKYLNRAEASQAQ